MGLMHHMTLHLVDFLHSRYFHALSLKIKHLLLELVLLHLLVADIVVHLHLLQFILVALLIQGRIAGHHHPKILSVVR